MTERMRDYWRGLVIAAAVSLRQIGTLPDDHPMRETHPYVLIQEEPESNGFAEIERVGQSILTLPSESTGDWSAN